MQPRFTHYCKGCTFIGQTAKLDLYVCRKGTPGGGISTVIGRFGDKGPEYVSGDGMVYIETPIGRVRLSIEKP